MTEDINNLVARNRQLRTSYLTALYEMSGGNSLKMVDEEDFTERTGIELKPDESWDMVRDSLAQEGKVRFRAIAFPLVLRKVSAFGLKKSENFPNRFA